MAKEDFKIAAAPAATKDKPASPSIDKDLECNEAVRKCSDWFEADRTAKDFYMEEMEQMYKLYKSDHWRMRGEDGRVLRTETQMRARPNAVENIAFALIEGFVAEFSQDIEIIDYPVEKGDDEIALVMTNLKEYVAYKNRIDMERERWLRWFFLYGTAIWHPYWDASWTGGKGPNRWHGDIRWKSLHPQVVYPDARCRESIEDGRRVHKAIWRTLEDVKEEFAEHGNLVMPDTIRHDMLVGDDVPMESSESEEEQALVVETWYKGEPLIAGDGDEEHEGSGLHVIWWAGEGNKQYLGHENYVYHDPGEDPIFPFIFRQCYPRENSVWGFGEAYYLKNPQIIRNKTAEIIIEGHVHHAMGQTIYNATALTTKQQENIKTNGTIPGMWFPVKDVQGVRRLQNTGVPGSLQNEMERNQKVSETLVGRFDISQGRTPGSVTAFRALDLLASRAQIRLRSKEKAMVTAYEDVGNYLNLLIERFYTQKRAYRILGADNDEAIYGIFDPNKLQKAYIYPLDQSMPLDEFQADGWDQLNMQEGQDYEIYCPQYDVQCKVSTGLPTDRIFYMDMAKELYTGQLIDQETFWYVLDNGKFPPFKDLLEKMEERMQQQQQPGAGGEQVALLEQAFAENPQMAAEFNAMSEPEQQQFVEAFLAQSGGGAPPVM